MSKIIFILLSTVNLFLVGCASTIKASATEDLAAKSFQIVKDKAVLYIYRNENYGGLLGMPVKINEQDIGETGAKTFFRLNLAPGLYVVTSEAENISEIPLTLIEGRNYYLWQEVRMGIWKARTSLHQVDEKTGMTGVLESMLLSPKISEDVISKKAIIQK